MIFSKEGEPVHAILLVLAKLSLDRYRNLVLINLAAIQQLHQEIAFLLPAAKHIFGEFRRIWKTACVDR